MSKSLVIVESPAKAKTINHYLGKDYIVKASMGHVRDLPKKKMGIDIAAGFQPTYEVIPEKKKTVADLKKAAKESERVILAADPDREGEAISWHLSQLLADANPNIFRVSFNEITEEGVQAAFKNLCQIDLNLFDAQQTRRILDRLAGYLISPLLWKKIARGLSAGRVQSVALRLIVDREKEIKAFVAEEYWPFTARLEAKNPPAFKAVLAKIEGKKAKVHNAEEAKIVREECERAPFVLDKVQVKPKLKHPGPPYITSTLQQDGFRLLRFPVKKTMFVAQKLYEGMAIGEAGQTGLITYMRTDSFRISEAAQAAARAYIGQSLLARPRPGQAERIQEQEEDPGRPRGHPARATSSSRPRRSSPSSRKRNTTSTSSSGGGSSPRRWPRPRSRRRPSTSRSAATSSRPRARSSSSTASWPSGRTGEATRRSCPRPRPARRSSSWSSRPSRNSPNLRARYTEGTLVKELEARGIGRPSTYAPTIATIQTRTYVVKEEGKFRPTELGMYVTEFLIKHFSKLLEYKFTAHMEEELDEIAEGARKGADSLKEFYALLEGYLKGAGEAEGVKQSGIPLDEKCPKCGAALVVKGGRFGQFKACSAYPACKFRESLDKKESQPLDEKCPQCGSPLEQKFGRFGPFIACSDYPKCKYIKKDRPVETGIDCPLGCGGKILKRKTRRGKFFFGCSRYPKCTFATWDDPIDRTCPQCGAKILYKKNLLRGEPYIYCKNEKCAFKEAAPREKIWEAAAAEAKAGTPGGPAPSAAPGEGGPGGTEPGAAGSGGTDEQGNR